ncbi:MAG: hypothetical protein JWP78_2430 [Mucilaginibacter sp.]|nr:hypothetical protein [Mucilaginibacter sp.]
MYWYNPLNKRFAFLIAGFIVLLSFAACNRDSSAAADTMKFFDIRGYFKADSIRLAKLNPLVNKTVVHNSTAETKKLHIANWGTELSLFTESDINKPAWKASYSIQSSGNFLIYKAKDPSLKTQEILIKKEGDRVKWILIFNHTKNILYENTEKLSYFPDSLYLIQKKQRVRLLGTDTYRINGLYKINDGK